MALNINAKFKGKQASASKNDMRNLANFYQSTFESLKTAAFIGSFYPKQKMYKLKIYRGVVSWQWRMMQNLKRTWLVSSKLAWGIWRILTRALENLKICTLMGCFWPKYIMCELKKCKGVMFDCTNDWCKIWRKTDLCFRSQAEK